MPFFDDKSLGQISKKLKEFFNAYHSLTGEKAAALKQRKSVWDDSDFDDMSTTLDSIEASLSMLTNRANEISDKVEQKANIISKRGE